MKNTQANTMTNLLYPTTNLAAIEQLSIVRGEGVYVFDSEGRRYMEGLAGLWCTALGYGNRELIETVHEQMATISYTHLFGGKTHPLAVELADRLAAMLPVKDARLFFRQLWQRRQRHARQVVALLRRRQRPARPLQDYHP